ncbi:MAG: EspA/EspE family type VII secretion system effector [Actinomycetota bacterium]|uniref:ESX-1 secretion-associated protein EspA/EspE-like domain-containing protein n=1 Tax=Mycobacterium lentiflavum TaxID=141349 RepID=A0ABY3V2P7_MYCLN|nr:EspA/EspE family type VII secretion system effector [Mycobacterium lentiflavum]MEE3067153.1 EspA/EspE family type VII secretion system effector [Actinomycetota bacterium]ULP43515.1 hypothetical protein MJO58_05945 [Mycobacterium lentiflavum]
MPEISDWAKGPFAFLGSVPAFTQGDYEKGAQGLVNSGGFLAFAAKRYRGDKETQEAFKAETKVLWYGILYIMSLQLLYMKATDTGKEFKTAKGDFEAAGQSLDAATAEDWGGWTGDGADNYNTQNDLQKTRAEAMSGLDADVYDILAKETKEVKRAVLNLGWEQTGLTCMIPICSMVYKTNPALSLKTQVTAVMCAVLASISIVKGTADDSSDNAGKLHKLRETYRSEGAGAAASLADLTSTSKSAAEVGPTTKSTVDQFETLNTAASFAAAATTPLAAPAASPSAAPAATPAAARVENIGGGVTASAPAASRGSYPVAGVSQAASPASTGAGVASQVTSTAKPAVPAKEQGAAGGDEGAERAPVDVAADGTQQAPSPVGRV